MCLAESGGLLNRFSEVIVGQGDGGVMLWLWEYSPVTVMAFSSYNVKSLKPLK